MGSILSVQEYKRPNSPNIHPFSREALGATATHFTTAGTGSAVWPAANRVILFPFKIKLPSYTIASLYLCNGAAVSGNFDLGIYDADESGTINRLVSTGSTVQAGTNVPQSVATAYTLVSGSYYAALCIDNTTATTWAKAPAQAVIVAAHGFAQVANGSVVLPSTLTLAPVTAAYIPVFGLSQKASV